jgi:hypothetical protein
MEFIALVIKYYFLGVILTSFIATWIFLDINTVIPYPKEILEDMVIGLVVGILWPATVPGYIYIKGVQLCRHLCTVVSSQPVPK